MTLLLPQDSKTPQISVTETLFLLHQACETFEHYREEGWDPEDLPAREDCLILAHSYAPSCSL